MSSTVFTIFMPVALALVMFGLGLTLTVADFKRVLKYPKATAVALACQLVVLPAVCFGLVLAFDLQGALAVGMMLLVAVPGRHHGKPAQPSRRRRCRAEHHAHRDQLAAGRVHAAGRRRAGDVEIHGR